MMTNSADYALAIANLKALYCATADSCALDPEGGRLAFKALFIDDVIADYGYGQLIGIAAVAEFLATSIAGESEWMLHMLHSPQIFASGNTATGDWSVKVHSKRRNGTQMEIVGRYHDEFHRTRDGWRIAKVTFRQFT